MKAILATVIIALISLLANLAPARISSERLNLKIGKLEIISGKITGDEIIDYSIELKQSQILSVDMLSSNRSAYFNVLPAGSDKAIFIGSIEGNVADVPVSATGDYVIRVYLTRNAARRNSTANYAIGISVQRPEFADGLSGGPDYWKVSSVSDGSSLIVRAGPSTRYRAVGRLSNGEVLQNRGCRLTGEERWCKMRATGSGLTGWVAGRFLIEAAPPRRPQVPAGGPVVKDVPFDATGHVGCATGRDQPLKKCPFGVVREGLGNAGVWITIGVGVERHILFESGVPISSNTSSETTFRKSSDTYLIHIGDEKFEIPEAVVYGG